MIQVRFQKSEDGKSLILTIKGHSGQAPIGKDIVCASASILAYTVAQAVLKMREQGKLKKRPTIRLDEGDAVITCKPNRAFINEAISIFSVAEGGYDLLAQKYPEFVNLTMFGKT